jgi:thiol-disulfide isomerase/thioredoxin
MGVGHWWEIGSRISMDDLKRKVVLPDFWATWCGSCREALPHLQSIAKKFEGAAAGGIEREPGQ